jgi:hypothetical protein
MKLTVAIIKVEQPPTPCKYMNKSLKLIKLVIFIRTFVNDYLVWGGVCGGKAINLGLALPFSLASVREALALPLKNKERGPAYAGPGLPSFILGATWGGCLLPELKPLPAP